MTKKFDSRKKRNKYLRISGQARKAAAMKELQRQRELRTVFETIKRVNAHNAALKEKHPELFKQLQAALKNVKSEVEHAATTMGIEPEDVKVHALDGMFDLSHVREVQAKLAEEMSPAEIMNFVAMDLADQGEWATQTPEEIREALITGALAFGLTREWAEAIANETFITKVTEANHAIHAARQESMNPMADGTVLIGEMISPYATQPIGPEQGKELLTWLDETAGMHSHNGAFPVDAERIGRVIEDELNTDAMKNRIANSSDEECEIDSKWIDGKRHSKDVREVIKSDHRDYPRE